MNHRQLKSAVFAVLFLTLFFGLSSCQKDDSSVNSSNEELYSSADLYTATYMPDDEEIIDPGIDNEMTVLAPPAIPQRLQKVIPLGQVLRNMGLSSEQIDIVKEALKAHRDCIKPLLDAMHDEVKTELTLANAARRDILAKLKSGEFTRDQAKEALVQLARDTRSAIHDIRKEYCPQIRECQKSLVEAIKNANLTDRQEQVLKRWLDSLPEMPCI